MSNVISGLRFELDSAVGSAVSFEVSVALEETKGEESRGEVESGKGEERGEEENGERQTQHKRARTADDFRS